MEGRRNFKPCPVREGDEMDLEIMAEGAKGDGVAKVSGYAIFVPGAKIGENVKVKITKTLPKFGFAEMI